MMVDDALFFLNPHMGLEPAAVRAQLKQQMADTAAGRPVAAAAQASSAHLEC